MPTHIRSAPAPTALTAFAALAALVLAGPASPASAQSTPDALEILRAAEARYEPIDEMCASFEQRLVVPLLDQEVGGRGRLCQRSPNLFSMRFTEPEGDLIVVDGSHLWLYTPSRAPKQVLKAPVGPAGAGGSAAPGGVLDFQREFLSDPGTKYAATLGDTARIGAETAQAVSLVPKVDQRYRLAVVWIGQASGMIRRVELHEENGSVRTVTLSDIDTKPTIPEGTFSFTPPPGTQVITS